MTYSLEIIRKRAGALSVLADAVSAAAASSKELRERNPDFVILEDDLVEDIDIAMRSCEEVAAFEHLDPQAVLQVYALRNAVEAAMGAPIHAKSWAEVRRRAADVLEKLGWRSGFDSALFELEHYWSKSS